MQTALAIAGFDPSSGAGITADLMVFAAHEIYGTSCITAMTVQSTVGVVATHAVTADVVRATLHCLEYDLPPAGIKIGMLSTAANVGVVTDFLVRLRNCASRIPVILDPVLRSTSGETLLEPAGVALLIERLLPLVDWVTPNVDELGILSGRSVVSCDDLVSASLTLQSLGRNLNVMATGGHLDPPDDLVLTQSGDMHWLPGERIITHATHGTGCALSSALLSQLLIGREPLAAAIAAKSYVAQAIRRAPSLGHGRGPINHLWTRP